VLKVYASDIKEIRKTVKAIIKKLGLPMSSESKMGKLGRRNLSTKSAGVSVYTEKGI